MENILTIALSFSVSIISIMVSYIVTKKQCDTQINAIKTEYDCKINQYEKNKQSDIAYKIIDKLVNTKQVNRALQEQFCEHFSDKNLFDNISK